MPLHGNGFPATAQLWSLGQNLNTTVAGHTINASSVLHHAIVTDRVNWDLNVKGRETEEDYFSSCIV